MLRVTLLAAGFVIGESPSLPQLHPQQSQETSASVLAAVTVNVCQYCMLFMHL